MVNVFFEDGDYKVEGVGHKIRDVYKADDILKTALPLRETKRKFKVEQTAEQKAIKGTKLAFLND